jgi:hypothetical protein
MTRALVSFIP